MKGGLSSYPESRSQIPNPTSIIHKERKFMHKIFLHVFIAFFALLIWGGAVSSGEAGESYPAELFTVTELHFDATRQACGLDCIIRQREVKDVLASVAGAMGINPAYVRAGLEVAYPAATYPSSEETLYTIPFVPGYTYCNTEINIVSIFSASNDPNRKSVVNASVFNDHVGIYTWTAKPRPGEGQSSVEGWAKVTHVKPEYFNEFKGKGVCIEAPPKQRGIFDCHGNPCSGGRDGSPSSTGSSTSALKTPPPGF